MQPYLLEAYGLVLWTDFARRSIGGPTSSGEEPMERVVVCIHPATSTAESVGPQSVRAGVQEPRAVAPMLRRRIHNEQVDRAVGVIDRGRSQLLSGLNQFVAPCNPG